MTANVWYLHIMRIESSIHHYQYLDWYYYIEKKCFNLVAERVWNVWNTGRTYPHQNLHFLNITWFVYIYTWWFTYLVCWASKYMNYKPVHSFLFLNQIQENECIGFQTLKPYHMTDGIQTHAERKKNHKKTLSLPLKNTSNIHLKRPISDYLINSEFKARMIFRWTCEIRSKIELNLYLNYFYTETKMVYFCWLLLKKLKVGFQPAKTIRSPKWNQIVIDPNVKLNWLNLFVYLQVICLCFCYYCIRSQNK